jgi:hypothetical protein
MVILLVQDVAGWLVLALGLYLAVKSLRLTLRAGDRRVTERLGGHLPADPVPTPSDPLRRPGGAQGPAPGAPGWGPAVKTLRLAVAIVVALTVLPRCSPRWRGDSAGDGGR